MLIPEIELKYLDEERNKFIGQQIAQARKAKKYKACELANAIGIGKDQYSKIENGKVTCTIDNLYFLAQYLDLDVQFLLFGKESDFFKMRLSDRMSLLDNNQIKRADLILDAAFGDI